MERTDDAIRVLVVEPDSLLRDMLRAVLSSHPRTRLVGAASDSVAALPLIEAGPCDVALIGIDAAAEQDALATAKALAAAAPRTRIMFLADRPDRRTLAALPAFRAAGWSYLLRQSVLDVAMLVGAIDDAARGLVVLDPIVVESLSRRDSKLSALTRRQLEVLSLMARGYNNAAIARSLVLEEKSVENHINAIFGQLALNRDAAAHPRVKAVLLYLNDGPEPDASESNTKAA